jgi:hypothetical protein
MRCVLSGSVVLLGGALVGCASAAIDPAGAEPGSPAVTAIISLERSAGPGDASRGDSVAARFVRARRGSVDESALRIAGIDAEIPAAGTCIVQGARASTTSPDPSGERGVELLDVGHVTIKSEGKSEGMSEGKSEGKSEGMSEGARPTVLTPRSMPDPAGVVSGVLYVSKAPDVFAPGSKISLGWPGGSDFLDGHSLTVTAPREPSELRVSYGPSGLDVSWDASEADARDVVYVDVASSSSRVLVRCASFDQGFLRAPASLVSIDEGTVSVHRTHTESFKARGIAPGEVRFDLSAVVPFRR